MKKLRIKAFQNEAIPQRGQLLVKGGVGCHDAGVIMQSNVIATGTDMYCGNTYQCTEWDGSAGTIAGVCPDQR